MKALIVGLICLLAGFWAGYIVYYRPFHVSYFDTYGNFRGRCTFDSIHKYEDSTVYFYMGVSLNELRHEYFYMPDIR